MTQDIYSLIEKYMILCMCDSAHDTEHVYRVLYNAMEIAKHERCVDYDVLICSCLLHDIGRKEEYEMPNSCHAQIGAVKAEKFLLDNHFDKEFVDKVTHCILCHRFRNNNVPQTIEAKILFDADKLDATGAIGIARTLVFRGQFSQPLYNLDAEGKVSNGENDSSPSFFREYKFKLEKLYDKFYTKHGAELAKMRQQAATSYYENLLSEVSKSYEQGDDELQKYINDFE